MGARTYKPKIDPSARERLTRCYKKLREDRAYVRGSSGVTVRQLESLIRLSEAVARVHFEEKVTVEFVNEAFELQMNTLKRPERESIDLNPEVDDNERDNADMEPTPEDPHDPTPAGQQRHRKMKLSYSEYERIGMMLTRYLAQRDDLGDEVKEEELMTWYMEQIEETIQTEAQLYDQQHLVQLIINRLIDKYRVLIVVRQPDDPSRPETRVLQKHPNFPVGEIISNARPR